MSWACGPYRPLGGTSKRLWSSSLPEEPHELLLNPQQTTKVAAHGRPSWRCPISPLLNTPDGWPLLCPMLGLSGWSMLVETVGQAWCVGLGVAISGSRGWRFSVPCHGILCDAHILFREKFLVIVPKPFGTLGCGILRMCLRLEQGCCPVSRVSAVFLLWPEEVCVSEMTTV